jgi:hypothetical protein
MMMYRVFNTMEIRKKEFWMYLHGIMTLRSKILKRSKRGTIEGCSKA